MITRKEALAYAAFLAGMALAGAIGGITNTRYDERTERNKELRNNGAEKEGAPRRERGASRPSV